MATETPKMINNLDVSLKNDRYLMNKLRDSGKEYVSSSGKRVAAKTQPGSFCHCPQKCKDKLPAVAWCRLFNQFYNLGDQNKQNLFLQNHIIIKAVHLHNWESDRPSPANKRRVTCKYHVPELDSDTELDEFVNKRSSETVEVCQKAFMNVFSITEKRVRMQRERCISRLAPDHYKNSPFGKKQRFKELPDSPSEEKDEVPVDFSKGRKKESEGSDVDTEQPLDLSSSKPRTAISPDTIDIDKTKLFEIAAKMGFSKERVEKEMADKYEQLVRKSLKKQLRVRKKRRTVSEATKQREIENTSPTSSEEEPAEPHMPIPPIQTLNNGDLTITPVFNSVSKPVETGDMMRVNYFFQNQLWKPEYIGLSSWKKLISQTYDI